MWRVKGESSIDAPLLAGDNGASAPPSRTASNGSINTFFAERGPGSHSRTNSSSSTLSGVGKAFTSTNASGGHPSLAGGPMAGLSLDAVAGVASSDGAVSPKLSFPGAAFTSPRQQNTRDRFVNPSFMSAYTIKSPGDDDGGPKKAPIPSFMPSVPNPTGGAAPVMFMPGPAPVQETADDVGDSATGTDTLGTELSPEGSPEVLGQGKAGAGMGDTNADAGARDDGGAPGPPADSARGVGKGPGGGGAGPDVSAANGVASESFFIPPPKQDSETMNPASASDLQDEGHGAEQQAPSLAEQFSVAPPMNHNNGAEVGEDVAFFSSVTEGAAGPFDPPPASAGQPPVPVRTATEGQPGGPLQMFQPAPVSPAEEERPVPQMFQPGPAPNELQEPFAQPLLPTGPASVDEGRSAPSATSVGVSPDTVEPPPPSETATETGESQTNDVLTAAGAVATSGGAGAPWLDVGSVNTGGERVDSTAGLMPEVEAEAVRDAQGGETTTTLEGANEDVATPGQECPATDGEEVGYENEWYAMVYGLQNQIAGLTSKVSEVEAERDVLKEELEGARLAQSAAESAAAAAAAPAGADFDGLVETGTEEARAKIEQLETRQVELLRELEGARKEVRQGREQSEAEVKEVEARAREQARELEIYKLQSLDLEKQLAGAKADLLAVRTSESLAQKAVGGDTSEIEEKLMGYRRQVEQLQKTIAFISVQSADISEERDAMGKKLADQEVAYLRLTGDMNDLLVCLGQESAKVQALEPHATRAGVDVDELLSRVEEEYGAAEPEDSDGT